MKKESIIQHYITQMPVKFEVDTEGPFILTGICIGIDTETGKALSVEPFRVIDHEIRLNEPDEYAEKKKQY